MMTENAEYDPVVFMYDNVEVFNWLNTYWPWVVVGVLSTVFVALVFVYYKAFK